MTAKTTCSLGAIILIVILVSGCDLPQSTPSATVTATPLPGIYLVNAQPTNIQSRPLLPVEPLFAINSSMFWEDFESDNLDVRAPP